MEPVGEGGEVAVVAIVVLALTVVKVRAVN